MKTLACKDLGTPECPFVAQGNTEEEVVGAMMAHAAEVHKEKIDEMKKTMSDADMAAMMRAKIQESA